MIQTIRVYWSLVNFIPISNNVAFEERQVVVYRKWFLFDCHTWSSKYRVFILVLLLRLSLYWAINFVALSHVVSTSFVNDWPTSNGHMNFSESKHRTRAQHRYSANWSARRAQHPWQTCRQIYPCPKCGRPFKWRYNLQHHLKFACGQSPRFNCPYCAFRTKHTSNVRAHVRRKHPGSEVYVVDILAWQQRNTTPTWTEAVRHNVIRDRVLHSRLWESW